MNGDRLLDLVEMVASFNTLNVRYWANMGNGRFDEPAAFEEHPGFPTNNEDNLFLLDVNTDGLADLVYQAASELRFWVNRGNGTLLGVRVPGFPDSGFVVDTPSYTSGLTPIRFADMNADGVTDILYNNPGSSIERYQYVSFCGDQVPHQLRSIDRGVGNQTTIEYDSVVSFQVAAESAMSPWSDTLPLGMQVVKRFYVESGLDMDGLAGGVDVTGQPFPAEDRYITDVVYRDPYYDPLEKQFRGFALVEKFDLGDDFFNNPVVSAPTQLTRIRYETGAPDGLDNDGDGVTDERGENEPLKGMKLWTEVGRVAAWPYQSPGYTALSDSGVFVRSTNTLQILRLHAPAGTPAAVHPETVELSDQEVRFPYIAESTSQIIELGSVPMQQIRREYSYDGYGNLVEELDSGTLGTTYDDERRVAMEYDYDFTQWILDRPTRILVTDENGVWVQETLNTYDDRGRPVLEQQLLDDSGASASIINMATLGYDDLGNLTQITNARGFSRYVTYDPEFGIYPVSESIEVGPDTPNLVTTAAYDSRFGVLTQSVDYNGNIGRYQYDSFGRLVSVILPGDSDAFPTTQYEYVIGDAVNGIRYAYDASGAVTETTGLGPIPSATRTLRRETFQQPGVIESFRYSDGLGRNLSSWVEHESSFAVVSSQLYNARGSARQGYLPYAASGPFLSGSVFPPQGTPHSETTYDATGRVVRTLLPPDQNGVQHEETQQFLPLESIGFDAEDNVVGGAHENTPVISRTDGLGRVVEVVEQNLIGAQVGLHVTEFLYDLQDNVLQVTDAQNNKKFMTYDGIGRRLSLHDPDSGLTQYTYDETSNVVQTVDALNRIITYDYDGLNRLLSEDYAGDGIDVRYYYDQALPQYPGARNLRGRLAGVTDLSGAEFFNFDDRGNPRSNLKQIRRVSGVIESYETSSVYDSLDRPVALHYPDGEVLRYRYNERGLLESIPGVVSHLAYEVTGQRSSCELANGAITTYGYDPRTRLRSMVTSSVAAPVLQDLLYELDGVNNVEQIIDGRFPSPSTEPRSMTQFYSYDDFYRLTEVVGVGYGTGNGSIGYSYDRIGNLVSKTSPTIVDSLVDVGGLDHGGAAGSFNRVGREPGDPPGPHAVSASHDGTVLFNYDDVGNRIERVDLNQSCPGLSCDEYEWDHKNRLIQVNSANGEVGHFVYDFSDRRVRKHREGQPDSEVVYVGAHCEVRSGVFTKFVFAGGERVARVEGPVPSVTTSTTQSEVLEAGWNFITLDVTPTSLVPEDVFASVSASLDALFHLEGASYLSFVPGMPSTLISLEPGKGYWVHTNEACTWTIEGTPYASSSEPLVGGWNQIRAPGSGSVALEDLVAANLDLISFWERMGNTQSWQSYSTGSPSFLQSKGTLRGGEGVLVFSANPTSLVGPAIPTRIFFYHPDHLGSANIVTDELGQIVEEQYFYPFGHQRLRSVPGLDVYTSEYTFTDKERDAVSGLYYFGTRHYDAVVGQFVSMDGLLISSPVLGAGQYLNGYAYCNNQPVVCVDPTGEFLVPAILIGAALGAVTEAANGGDFGDILRGAVIGGVLGGVSGGVGELAGHAVFGGMASGALNAAFNGGDVGDILLGAAMGGASSSLGGAVGASAGDSLGTIGAGALAGGVTSFIIGGIATGSFSFESFAMGAGQGAISAGLGSTLRSVPKEPKPTPGPTGGGGGGTPGSHRSSGNGNQTVGPSDPSKAPGGKAGPPTSGGGWVHDKGASGVVFGASENGVSAKVPVTRLSLGVGPSVGIRLKEQCVGLQVGYGLSVVAEGYGYAEYCDYGTHTTVEFGLGASLVGGYAEGGYRFNGPPASSMKHNNRWLK